MRKLNYLNVTRLGQAFPMEADVPVPESVGESAKKKRKVAPRGSCTNPSCTRTLVQPKDASANTIVTTMLQTRALGEYIPVLVGLLQVKSEGFSAEQPERMMLGLSTVKQQLLTEEEEWH
jgi:hypothetical protein